MSRQLKSSLSFIFMISVCFPTSAQSLKVTWREIDQKILEILRNVQNPQMTNLQRVELIASEKQKVLELRGRVPKTEAEVENLQSDYYKALSDWQIFNILAELKLSGNKSTDEENCAIVHSMFRNMRDFGPNENPPPMTPAQIEMEKALKLMCSFSGTEST